MNNKQKNSNTEDENAMLESIMSRVLKQAKAVAPEGIRPQKVPRNGSTPLQILCTQLAYILYQLEFDDPNIPAKKAFENYCKHFDECYPV